MNHSTSKRSAKAMPQQEATMLVEHTDAKIIKCRARKAFSLGNSHIAENEVFFLVRSERREHRYYVVHFNTGRGTYQCSCGANCSEHAHLKVVREYVMNTVVAPAKAEAAKSESSEQVEVVEPTPMSVPLTSAQWKEIMKRDKARQKAEKAKDWQKVLEAREQGKREAALAG